MDELLKKIYRNYKPSKLINKFNTSSNKEKTSKNSTSTSSDLVQEGIIAGQKIAKISVITLLSIGIVEIIAGYYSGSNVATADGIDSASDSLISFIVLIGLRIAHKPADRKFHFGYHKVESLAALMAAIGMTVIGAVIFYNSYQAWLHPHEINHPYIVMAVLAGASALSLHRAFQMRTIANKYNLLSLKTDARNSIKDGSASVVGFFSILLSTQFGILQMDAIGGMIIALYIFSVSYISLKRSSLILVDSWQNPKLTVMIKNIISEEFKDEKIRIREVLLRSSGMVDQAEIHLEVDGKESVSEVEELSLKIQDVIISRFPSIERISVVPHSYSGTDSNAIVKRNLLRNIKLKKPSAYTNKNKLE
ncbi:MAG: cation diffusion facilitator family transporter [Thermoproteota archaeon]|nr:cation diffusion facilitator family transporter [Thermoproteota archaeon]